MTASVHVLEEIDLALPVDRYRGAFPIRRGGFVFDGGDHAMLGAEPFLSLRAFRASDRLPSGALAARVVVERQGQAVHTEVGDPLEILRTLMREHAVDPSIFKAPRALPFLGGAVGYIGYETGQMLERLPCPSRAALDLPDVALFFHDWVLGRDHSTGRSFLSVLGRGATTDEARREAERTRDRLLSELASFEQRTRFPPSSPPRLAAPALSSTAASLAAHAGAQAPSSVVARPTTALLAAAHAQLQVSRDAYLDKIRVAKEHILKGDAFEICLTHRIDAPFEGDAFALWQHLRRASPAPFAAFLDLPEAQVVSSSPERFLSVDAARVVESRPIKGTRPRGATTAEDARLATDLASSSKDRAENTMIVDLVRNDLGRVCRFGTVEVPALCVVERYATVHQLVSTVQGQLEDGRDAVDVVRACFPPGSMTGAPKIEAMTILEKLEPTERGVYSGALGWLDFAGPIDLSVVIRTVIVKDGTAHLHVGGAIVADSDAAAEHDETMDKARALLAAIAALTPEHASAQSTSAPLAHGSQGIPS